MRNRAVFTIVHNERVFLPIWLSYYSRYFDGKDIYVINHNLGDDSVAEAKKKHKFNEEVFKTEDVFNHTTLAHKVREKQQELLKKYKCVLFAEADEIIVPDPGSYGNLTDYINELPTDYVRCTGYDIVQNIELETPLDLTRPILKQRDFWSKQDSMNKPLLSKVSLNWNHGFHTIDGENIEPDPKLYLLHLKRMDWGVFKQRWEETGIATVTSTTPSLQFHQHDNNLERIPEHIKEVI